MKTLLLTLTVTLLAFTRTGTAADANAKPDHQKSPMAAELTNKSGSEFEAAYLGMMILHHQGGAPMWALAREKATNEELKAMEKKTTPKEQQEIAEMTTWLKQWHGKTPQDFSQPDESRKMMAKDMEELKAAGGKEFDALFAKKMAHHHMGAIEMAKLAAEKATHPEVKASAKAIVTAQTEDREKLLLIAGHSK